MLLLKNTCDVYVNYEIYLAHRLRADIFNVTGEKYSGIKGSFV